MRVTKTLTNTMACKRLDELGYDTEDIMQVLDLDKVTVIQALKSPLKAFKRADLDLMLDFIADAVTTPKAEQHQDRATFLKEVRQAIVDLHDMMNNIEDSGQ